MTLLVFFVPYDAVGGPPVLVLNAGRTEQYDGSGARLRLYEQSLIDTPVELWTE